MNKAIIPNLITGMRILGAVLLLFVSAFRLPFYIIFTLCGITDALDGYLARKLGVTSELGSKLDGFADVVFYSIMVLKLFPVMLEKMPIVVWIMLAVAIGIRGSIYVVSALKFSRFASSHTYLNKASGMLAFLAPYFAPTAFFAIYCGIWCVLGIVSAIEDLLLHINSKQYPDKKSILIK
ncbi:MAG: CDP-alcohol phosphatidyltransferase family protein [Clostridia bacterium]|nr:CDP-alcohol phosphatidyltransferase family protein [Clostridia bacterium]